VQNITIKDAVVVDDLPNIQVFVLREILNNPDATQSEIADKLGVTTNTVRRRLKESARLTRRDYHWNRRRKLVENILEHDLEDDRDKLALADGGDEQRADIREEKPAWLHEDVEINEDGTAVGPSGTKLVNARGVSVHEREGDVTWIDRRSRWGNPFKTQEDGGDYTRRESVALYNGWFHGEVEKGELDPEELRGETLACWCTPLLCHGHVILSYLAETYEPQQELATDGGGIPAAQSGSHYTERTLPERVENPADADIIKRVCQSCGDIVNRWQDEEIDDLLTDDGNIPQGFDDGCLSCGGALVAWEFYSTEVRE
jgi:DNA-binding Lrp family transcriptional regulator